MSELLKRYEQSLKLLKRVRKVLNRPSWADGETDSEVGAAIDSFLEQEQLEDDFFGVLVPAVKGSNVPDLRGREHLCDKKHTCKQVSR